MTIRRVGAFEAKTHLSEILEQVSRGQVYHITRRGRLVAELRPATPSDRRPRYGSDRGRIAVGRDFDAPVPGMAPYIK
jgi:prevent-host-death family protein